DNLRRIGLALNTYADGKGRFPPAVIGPAEQPPEKQLAWTCEVVPRLGSPLAGGPQPGKAQQERLTRHFEEIHGRLDLERAWGDPANQAAVDTPIRFFLCPSSPGFDPNRSP